MKTPKNIKEYRETIWAFCRNCTGRSRQVAGDCTKTDCDLYPVYSMPRVLKLNLDYTENLQNMIDVAFDVSSRHSKFTMMTVRINYYAKYKNGVSLDWSNLAKRKEWLAHFEQCGETISLNERSHGDKVKLWRRK